MKQKLFRIISFGLLAPMLLACGSGVTIADDGATDFREQLKTLKTPYTLEAIVQAQRETLKANNMFSVRGAFTLDGHNLEIEEKAGAHFVLHECFAILEKTPNSQKKYSITSVLCDGPPSKWPLNHQYTAHQRPLDPEVYDIYGVVIDNELHDVWMEVQHRDPSTQVPDDVWFFFTGHKKTDGTTEGQHPGAGHAR
jgi:hypothetical protein